jgi:DHA1 family purine base/nucleoside efflux pump-like MFS transporter
MKTAPVTSTDRREDTFVKGLLFVVAFLGYFVPLILPILARDIARELHIDISNIGFLVGAQGILVGLASLVIGPLSDSYGRKRVLSFFVMANAVGVIAFSQAWDLWSFYALGVLSAVGFGPLIFCSLAYAGDYFSEDKQGSAVGLITGALWASVIVGVPLGVILIEMPLFGWRAVFVGLGILSLAAGLVSIVRLRDIPTGAKTIQIRRILVKYASFLRERRLLGFLAIFLIMRVGVGMYLTYGPPYLFISRAFPPSGFATIYPICGVAALASSILASRLADRIGRTALVVISNVSIIVSIFMFVHFPTTPSTIYWVMMAVCCLYMVSESLRMATLQAEAVSTVGKESRGAFLGAVSFLLYCGTAAGAFLGGAILDAFKRDQIGASGDPLASGYTFIVYCTAVLWAVTVVLVLYYTRQRPSVVATETTAP